MSIIIDVGSYIEIEYGDVHNLECEISGNFPFAINESLRKEHRFEVRARFLQMLLKFYGHDLFRLFGGYESPDDSNGSLFIEAACAGLSRYWESKNTLKEHQLGIEALTIAADILFSIDEVPLLRAYSMLRCIGEAFEARGDLKKGAKLFWEMHEYFTEDLLEGWSRGDDDYIEEEESVLHTLWRASWLYLCADEFDRSELAHVHAWYYWKKIKGYMDLKVIQNCLLLYYKSEELHNNTEIIDGSKKKVNIIFHALVKRAGILDGEDDYQIHDMIEAVPYRMLKPSSRKKAKAKKHLLRLADTLNVDHFRELLLEAYNSADQDPFVESIKYDGVNKYLTAAHKTKKDFKKRNASSITCQVCHKVEKYKQDIKISFQCECKSFYYCSQACQLIHWGTHRHFCPLKIKGDAADFSFRNCRKCSKPTCNDEIKKSAQCPCQPDIVSYCSKQCKRDDWKVHEPEHSLAKESKNGKQRDVNDERINLYFGRLDLVDNSEKMASMWGV
ncbi:hypothetical protein CTEN210_18450 [Chaetoceros tenuissimus]|uniref:MYND-type domain-containing protein n=1 Tax=Chaetoceros tenuissimus TaxID=426638 RepID=A0AAD3DCK6_9STRA|nr:hypothetical protein CTEN210_18450 [Chaetoceros tenuissimus]